MTKDLIDENVARAIRAALASVLPKGSAFVMVVGNRVGEYLEQAHVVAFGIPADEINEVLFQCSLEERNSSTMQQLGDTH